MAKVRGALEAAQGEPLAPGVTVEAATARLLIDAGMDCVATELPTPFAQCGTRETGYVSSGQSPQAALASLANFQLPVVLKPPPQ